MIIKQISVFLENRVGQLTEIISTLADNGIDLRAINIAETSDYGVIRLITNNNDKTIEVLDDNEYVYKETPVVVMAVKDEVGGLAKMLSIMSSKHFNIEYMYSIFSTKQSRALMVFRVDNPEELENLLLSNGYEELNEKDLGI